MDVSSFGDVDLHHLDAATTNVRHSLINWRIIFQHAIFFDDFVSTFMCVLNDILLQSCPPRHSRINGPRSCAPRNIRQMIFKSAACGRKQQPKKAVKHLKQHVGV